MPTFTGDSASSYALILRDRYGDGRDGSLRVSGGAWQTDQSGTWQNITTVAGKWSVSGSTLILRKGLWQLRNVTAPSGYTLQLGSTVYEIQDLRIAGEFDFAGNLAGCRNSSGIRFRSSPANTSAAAGANQADRGLSTSAITTPAASGTGGGAALYAGADGQGWGTDRPYWVVRRSAPVTVAGTTTAGIAGTTQPAIGYTFSYDTLPVLPGADGLPGGSGALNQTGGSNAGGAGSGSATTAPAAGDGLTRYLGAFGGGIVRIRARVVKLYTGASINADGEAAQAAGAGVASGADLTIAGGGAGGGGGGGGTVGLLYGTLFVDGVDRSDTPTHSSVTAIVHATGGAGGAGGAGKTRIDSIPSLLAWQESTNYSLGAFRRPPSPAGSYIALTVDHTKVGSGGVSGFPVLITEASLPSDIFDADGDRPALNGGGDIYATSDEAGLTRIPIEVVKFTTDNNPANGRAEIWVKTDVSSSTDTTFYLWWGGDQTVQPAATDPYGRNAVWADYAAVMHLQENPGGSAPQMIDSTGNGHNGTTANMSSGDSVTGKVGAGVSGNGSNQSIQTAHTSALDTSTLVFSAWLKTTDGNVSIIASKQFSGSGAAWWMKWYPGDSGIRATIDPANAPTDVRASFDGSAWTHVVFVYDRVTMRLYVNGSLAGTSGSYTPAIPVSASTGVKLFSRWSNEEYWSGQMDEVRVGGYSSATGGAAAILTQYNNQNAPGTFVTSGPIQSVGEEPPYIAIVCAKTGISGSTAPTWPETAGVLFNDGTAQWVSLAEGSNVTNTRFSGGAGAAGTDGVVVIERAPL